MADVILYQFPGAYGLASLSPFCTKLEAYLRLAGIDHETKLGDPRRAPKGKLPYVRLGGELLGDSGFIIEGLKQRFGDRLDAELSPRQHAFGHLAQRCAEEHLYWGVLQARWDDDRAWEGGYRDIIAGMVPKPLGSLAAPLIRRSVRKSLLAHGMGRHTPTEIAESCTRDLDAVIALLAEAPFLVTDAPTRYDCSVYAMLEHLRRTPSDHPLVRAVQQREPLVEYCARMNERLGW